MNIARTKTVVHLEPAQTVDSLTEAKQVAEALAADTKMAKKDRDAYNGLLEAFFVGYFRKLPKSGKAFAAGVKEVQSQFPKDNRVTRALHRTKAFRGKNRGWKSITIGA